MESQIIECKLIDVPKAKAEDRSFVREFAINLADSIKIDGLINAVVVRRNPASPGRFILVAGRHRLYAIKKVLKEQFIRATVIEDMDDEEADIAGQVENLWRSPLSKAQHALALKRWHERWMAKSDKVALEPKGSLRICHNDKSSTEDAASANDTDATNGDGEPRPVLTDSERSAAKKENSEAKFDETVSAATGQSITSVRRAKRIADAFTADQLEVFTQMGVNQKDMLTISRIKDKEKVREIVNLIAAGMEPTEAVDEIMKEKAPARYNEGSKADSEAKAAAKKEADPKVDDDEWFADQCGEKAAMLKNPAKFKTDAILYRRVTELRHTFRVKGKKFVAEAKKTGVYGGFTNLVNRFISLSHPKDWFICPDCKGTGEGHNPLAGQPAPRCNGCFGGGYKLKTEEYL